MRTLTGMALVPGSRTGLDDIVSTLGADGMGEVHRAPGIAPAPRCRVSILPGSFAGLAYTLS